MASGSSIGRLVPRMSESGLERVKTQTLLSKIEFPSRNLENLRMRLPRSKYCLTSSPSGRCRSACRQAPEVVKIGGVMRSVSHSKGTRYEFQRAKGSSPHVACGRNSDAKQRRCCRSDGRGRKE